MIRSDTGLSAVLSVLLLLGTGDLLRAQPARDPAPALPSRPPSLDELDTLVDGADYAAAEAKARHLLRDLEDTFGPDSLQVAWTLDKLLEALRRGTGTATDEAFELARRAVGIKEARLGTRHPELGSSLNELALLHYFRDELPLAVGNLRRVLDILEETSGLEDPGAATVLNNLGVVLIQAGDLEEALAVHRRALDVRRRTLEPEHPDLAQSAYNLALVHQKLGHLKDALPLAEESVELLGEVYGAEHPRLAEGLHLLGSVLNDYGRYSEARVYLERSLAIREAIFGDDHPSVSDSLIDLANLISDLGDPAAAEPLYERALDICEAAFGADSGAVALALNNLGIAQADLGFHRQARRSFERALAIRERLFGPDHPGVATLLNNLAEELWALGEPDDARQAFLRALDIRREKLPSPHPLLAESLGNLASFLAGTGETDRSLLLHERAVELYEQTLGATSFRVGGALSSLAEARLARNPAAALDAALRAEAIGREHLRKTVRHLSERQALDFARVRAAGLDVALTLAASGRTAELDRVWDALIRGRALILDELTSRHRLVAASRDPALRALAEETAALRRQQANLLVRGGDPDDLEGFEMLLRELEETAQAKERALAGKTVPLGVTVDGGLARSSPGFLEVVGALPEESALVSFARYVHVERPATPLASPGRPTYLALVLRSDTAAPVVVGLGPASRLEPAVARWRRAVVESAAKPGDAAEPSGRALAELVWDRIASHLAGARRVFVVPDGMLHLVHLAALPRADGRYVVEEPFTLHYLTTERDLLAPPPPPRVGAGSLLALGGPDYDATVVAPRGERSPSRDRVRRRGGRVPCPELRALRFDPLPATVDEVEAVAELWAATGQGPARVLTGAAATESALKENAAGRSVLHLATHGFFLGEPCTSTLGGRRGIGALAPAAAPDGEREAAGDSFRAALSGLVLAGANHRHETTLEEDDGVLTAEEIATLDLRGVEWAVLSACETALGEVRSGEGVFGLQRAFRIAGVQTVVMSLWPVDDESSREWMEIFYEGRLDRHLGTAEAVQWASRRLLERRRRRASGTAAFHWGGFLAAGRWR